MSRAENIGNIFFEQVFSLLFFVWESDFEIQDMSSWLYIQSCMENPNLQSELTKYGTSAESFLGIKNVEDL